MKFLHIEPTKVTPGIDFDPKTSRLSIKGQSYPENAFKFYEPVFKWVDEYMKEDIVEIKVEIEFNFPYINTSSAKCIMMFLEKFENYYSEGKKVIVNWYYDMENESEFECAEEFKEDVMLPFNLIPVESI